MERSRILIGQRVEQANLESVPMAGELGDQRVADVAAK